MPEASRIALSTFPDCHTGAEDWAWGQIVGIGVILGKRPWLIFELNVAAVEQNDILHYAVMHAWQDVYRRIHGRPYPNPKVRSTHV